jgi:hypothetical protein
MHFVTPYRSLAQAGFRVFSAPRQSPCPPPDYPAGKMSHRERVIRMRDGISRGLVVELDISRYAIVLVVSSVDGQR